LEKCDLKVIFKITIVKILEKNSGITFLQYIPFNAVKKLKKFPQKKKKNENKNFKKKLRKFHLTPVQPLIHTKVHIKSTRTHLVCDMYTMNILPPNKWHLVHTQKFLVNIVLSIQL
jgi:hypothetical protein